MKVYRPYTGVQKIGGCDKMYEDDPYYLQAETARTFMHPKTKERFVKEQRHRPYFSRALLVFNKNSANLKSIGSFISTERSGGISYPRQSSPMINP